MKGNRRQMQRKFYKAKRNEEKNQLERKTTYIKGR